jgi:acetoin utilization deacetylase AcuC-like enzyme
VIQGLERAGLLGRCRILPPRPATDTELLRCHTPGYLQRIQEDIAAGRAQLSTGDTAISPYSERTARLAAGGVLAAVEAVMEQRVRRAFAVVRPPGHHASAARGMGFCIYNNIAVAARQLQAVHGLERILVVDWDVHHGNGTQDIFWSDPSVLFFSSHQAPLYPGSGSRGERGEGAGAGTTRNCPLPAGTSGPELVAAWREELLPLAEDFAPDFVLISAGFDSRAGDPLGRPSPSCCSPSPPTMPRVVWCRPWRAATTWRAWHRPVPLMSPASWGTPGHADHATRARPRG